MMTDDAPEVACATDNAVAVVNAKRLPSREKRRCRPDGNRFGKPETPWMTLGGVVVVPFASVVTSNRTIWACPPESPVVWPHAMRSSSGAQASTASQPAVVTSALGGGYASGADELPAVNTSRLPPVASAR